MHQLEEEYTEEYAAKQRETVNKWLFSLSFELEMKLECSGSNIVDRDRIWT